MFKKTLSILLSLCILFGILTILPISAYAEETDIAEAGADSELSATGATQKAMFIMDTINISQGMYGNFSHQGSMAIDLAGKDGGKDPAYAPFDGKVVYMSSSAAYIIYESLNPVEYADGTVDYMTVWVMHDDNIGRFYVGQTFSQGEHFFDEGSSGYATGNHIHLECARGTYARQYQNSYGVWCLNNQIAPYDALYLSESTNIIDGYGYNWRRTSSGTNFSPVYMGEHFYANIINPSCGKAVVATGDNAGDNVVLSTLDGKLLHKWEFVHYGNNVYKIVNNHSGKCLDVSGASSENGANIHVWDSNDSDAQLWYFKAVGNGYSLVPKCATNRSLDIYDGNTNDGTNIQIWESWDGNPQIFTLNYLPEFTAQNLGQHFYANIVHQDTGKAVVAVGDNAGDNVVLSTLDGKLLHKWEFIRQNDWSYKIINNHSGKALDVSEASSSNGANIQVFDSNNTNAQLWYIKAVGNGYSLVPKCALNSSLDIKDGNTADGSNIQLWDSWEGSPQIFSFNYLPSFVAQNLGKHFYANIVHLKSNKPVIAVGDKNGDNVELGEFSGAIINKWEFIRQNDWSYKIVNNHSGKCLDVFEAGSANMTNIQVWNSNNSNAQLWYIKAVGDGYSLVPKCALSSALDLENGKTSTGTNISLHQQNSTAAQIFYFNYQPADVALDIGDSFDAYLIHKKSGYAVTYSHVGGNALVMPHEGSPDQLWHFEKQKDLSYTITTWNSEFSIELTLEVEKNYTSDGSNVQVGELTSTNNQKWFFIENGDGYSLIPKCAVNRAMDLDKGIYQESSDLNIYGLEKGNTNQIFQIKPPIIPLQDSMVIVNDIVITSDVTEVTPKVTVKANNKILKVDTDYSLTSTADIANGIGTVTVTGKNGYSGTITKNYKITIDDRNKITDSMGNQYYANQGEIVTFIINLTSPRQVNYLNGILYYNQDILEPIITDDIVYHAPNFASGQFHILTPGQIEFDIYSDNPVSLNNSTIVKMQFRLTTKGKEGWLAHEFKTPEFTWENQGNYGLETKVLTNQELYVPTVNILGDVDGDGEATIIDATYIQRYNVNMQIPITEETLKKCGDVDGDGEVSVIDATFIQRFEARIPTPYLVGEPIS